MKCGDQRRVFLDTSRGEIVVQSFMVPDDIARLDFSKQFMGYASYSPIISKKESLLAAAAKPGANVTLACTVRREIVGLAILDYPAPEERWARVGNKAMLELAAIEVSQPFRSAGIASTLLRLAVDHPDKETLIFYMVGYSWTWDLEAAGRCAIDYRNGLIRLFAKEGFEIFQTNEPNVMLRPENLFMARVGARVSQETVQRFKMVRFNLDL
jgi:acetoin utilization protein AcuA